MQWMNRARQCVAWGAAVVALFVAGQSPAVAQANAAKVPMENFFKKPQFLRAQTNPTGTHLAYIREVNGRWNLVQMELATRKLTNIAGYDKADVVEFIWINDKRIMYRIADARVAVGDNEQHGWFAADIDGTRPLTLSEGLVKTGGLSGRDGGLPARARFYSRVRSGNPDDFIAIQYAEAPLRSSLLRINSRDGRRTIVDVGGLTNVRDWALDFNDVPRAAVSATIDTATFHVRDSATSPWRKVAEFSLFDNKAITPVRFDKAGNLYVSAYMGRDTAAIYRFDWAKNAPESQPVVSVKDYDIDGGLIFSEQGNLIGVRFEADHLGTHWIDPVWKAQQEIIDNALPGRINLLSGYDPNGLIVVRTSSDTSPAKFYLFDTKAKKLSMLGNSMPWVDEKTQARSDVIRYKARDGLTIPALLTLPKGVEPKKLPLVVLAHGGPYVRGIEWEWERDRQFLASRGYAVVEPDFRGSTGHGWKLHRAGWKQWGLAMQDDLADAVLDLADKGIVDKNRVCIAGASYGGYATVMGLIRHPELYKCGISWVGVTDIELLHTVGWSDTADSPEQRLSLDVLVGDLSKDKEQLRATSAIHQAARLKQPLIIAYGLADVRVPYDHGQKLRDALKPHNKNVQYIEYAGEGHGWGLLETNIDFWTRAEKLLAETIGK